LRHIYESTKAYYGARSIHTNDQIYRQPERQAELARLRRALPSVFKQRQVLELASGTGYWTQCIAAKAASIEATDINENLLAVAASQDYGRCHVTTRVVDALTLDNVEQGAFDAAFAGCWWSHLLREDLAPFLERLVARLLPGSPVAFVDNLPSTNGTHNNSWSNRTDDNGNTIQLRRLDGTEYAIVKNSPIRQELSLLLRYGESVRFIKGKFYWVLAFRTRNGDQGVGPPADAVASAQAGL
jgi:SAM-dependent methyltransferase